LNPQIKSAIETGRLVLLLGAGASITSLDRYNNQLLSGNDLAKLLAEEAGFSYQEESLSVVYSAVRKTLGDRLTSILEEKYRHCKPSKEFEILSKYAWVRIYTLNIDDAFEIALTRHSSQLVSKRYMTDAVHDQDQLFRELDYIKLNGSVDKIRDGLIFSPKEYGKGSASPTLWYSELAEDFFKYKFLFIGTKLNEPLFYHQIERYRSVSGGNEQRSYVLTPSATEIEKNSLDELNLEHIPGTLSDFTTWLQVTFPTPLTGNDLAMKRHPELEMMMSLARSKDPDYLVKAYQHVIPVGRSFLTITTAHAKQPGKIRDFYKGFKPDWQDILDEVPAKLMSTDLSYKKIITTFEKEKALFVITGPAGSGKSTLLKQLALQLSDNGKTVYFIDFPVDNLKEIVTALESSNSERYCIFYDRIGSLAQDLEDVLNSGIMKKGFFIGAESQSAWDRRVAARLEKYSGNPFKLEEINEPDAKNILIKLEQFGPWTRLSKLTQKERVHELLHKAKRQLLIGLLETTMGVGFEKIIERDYSTLNSEEERLLLVVVGLATANKVRLDQTYASRALTFAGLGRDVANLCRNMSGILKLENGFITARHPVYIRHLFERVLEKSEISKGLLVLMEAFSVYGSPIIKKVGKNEGILFKSLINHSFLKDLLSADEKLILNFYQSFEKRFENDGLFWLQYGLALRDFNRQQEAYEKLRTAFEAYPHPHTEHALAQQELVIASKSPSLATAYSLLESAKKRLESLDKTLQSDDTYPIVTLSEGHTDIVRRFEGDEKAKILATYYANLLERRIKLIADGRLKKAWTKLTKYLVTGEWIEEEATGYSW